VFESRSWRGVPDATLRDKFLSVIAAGRWFSPDTPVMSGIRTHNFSGDGQASKQASKQSINKMTDVSLLN
jgi:hypothetical protein